MPKVSSAAKQARASERKRLRNQSAKSNIRSGLRQFYQLLKSNPPAAKEHGCKVISLLDRASKSKILHFNTTRRYKSRIMTQLQAVSKKA